MGSSDRQVAEASPCDRVGPWALPSVALPYQADVIDLYVLEEGAGHTLCVPLHSWVIWKLAEREKRT